ncbi:DEAD/DEAH box helicase [Fluviicola sp.]|uniref:DEAD/DEAH box helicase n=1 Tax=Fluviicola sp. TaxID=1917219 RepID=UPI0031D00D4F
MQDIPSNNLRKRANSIQIDLLESIIVISSIDLLKKYQLAQLDFYGYKKDQSSLYKTSDSPIRDIIKITDYLVEEKINYELSNHVAASVSLFQKKKERLNEVFTKVKVIKEQGLLDDDFSEFKQFTETLPRKLKPHQLKSAYHFYALKNGANFSVPGSGKTSTVLSVYEKLRREDKCNILFIVGPPSCFQPWKNEFKETLGRIPDSLILSGVNKHFRKNEYQRPKENASELYLCTFHTALNDTKDIIKFLSQNGINAFMIIDEAHYMKQLGGSWANSLLEIGQHAVHKGILTGTPIPKSYKDLFNLFDFLWEESASLSQEDKIRIEVWEKQRNVTEVKKVLEDKIGPLFYRVRKKDLGLIPARFHSPIIVEMNENERIIYDYVQTKIIDLNQQDYFKNENTLTNLRKGRMIRLRQAVSYAGLLSSSIEDYDESIINNDNLNSKIINYNKIEIPGKLQALIDLVATIQKKDKKILIWSNFVGTLKLIKSHLIELGYGTELIYGKTPIRKDDSIVIKEEKTREDIRDEFLDLNSGLDILIANPAACAESISLHKTCFHAIYYDLSYNCAQYLQSLDRIHRVGGSELNEANYYFLQYANSIDQDIKHNLENKAEKMYDIIEQDYSIYDLNLYEEEEDDITAYKRLFTKH